MATAHAVGPRPPTRALIGDRGRLVILDLATGTPRARSTATLRFWSGYRTADLPGCKVSADRVEVASWGDFSGWVAIADVASRGSIHRSMLGRGSRGIDAAT